MIGQHPQMYALPELHLFAAETMQEWWMLCENPRWRAHGALRVVAQLYYGGQTENTIEEASGWLRRRSHLTTGMFLEMLASRVHPRRVVEKSPSITYNVEYMERTLRVFPTARYLHLLRHPRTQAESIIRHQQSRRERGVLRDRYWQNPPAGWFTNHTCISEFLASVDDRRQMRVRAEDLLGDPDRVLQSIFEWLGVRTDVEAVEAAKHPERSVYACVGPKGAHAGNDGNFLRDPVFRMAPIARANLDDPVSWSPAGEGFPPRVKRLAREFGYD